jgi:hypothetical protein
VAFETVRQKLVNWQQAHAAIVALSQSIKPWIVAGHQLQIEVKAETRSTAANRLLWSCLHDISRQVHWPVDGTMQKLEPEEWKHIFTAGLKKHQRVAQGIEGGFVMLGSRTSRMTRAEMTELIDLIHAFGDSRELRWSRTSLGRDVPEEYFEEAGAC